MAEVRISEAARIDIEGIRALGVESFGEDAAERHLRDLRAAFALLAESPFAGQERPEFRQDMRAIARRPHRILYTVVGETVLIVRVIHQARDVPTALRGMP